MKRGIPHIVAIPKKGLFSKFGPKDEDWEQVADLGTEELSEYEIRRMRTQMRIG